MRSFIFLTLAAVVICPGAARAATRVPKATALVPMLRLESPAAQPEAPPAAPVEVFERSPPHAVSPVPEVPLQNVAMMRAGMVITLVGGLVSIAAGIIVANQCRKCSRPGLGGMSRGERDRAKKWSIVGLVGAALPLLGVPLWIIGARGKSDDELTEARFAVEPAMYIGSRGSGAPGLVVVGRW